MNCTKNKLRVVHFPQVSSCRESFKVDVNDEEQALKILNVLADQHLWLERNRIIPDYSNAIFVEMFNSLIDDWVNYHNEQEDMDWDEFVETYLSDLDTSSINLK